MPPHSPLSFWSDSGDKCIRLGAGLVNTAEWMLRKATCYPDTCVSTISGCNGMARSMRRQRRSRFGRKCTNWHDFSDGIARIRGNRIAKRNDYPDCPPEPTNTPRPTRPPTPTPPPDLNYTDDERTNAKMQWCTSAIKQSLRCPY